MPISTRFRPLANLRLSRRAAPSCRGGASSLLRLVQPATSRLPSTLDIGGWVSRAANAMKMPAAPMFAPSEFTAG